MDTEWIQLGQYSLALGALVVGRLLGYHAVPYLLDPYDYRRRFPGPPLAGLTNWWMSMIIQTGHHSEIVQCLHEKYGTFVRLGPNHISIADPDALEVAGSDKNNWAHSEKRKRVANIFSAQNSLAFEPRIRSHIRQLCAQWDLRCKGAVRGVSSTNRAIKVSYLAFDIIGDLALGSPFGLVQAQKDSSLSIESVDESGEATRGTVEIPVIETIARAGVPIMSIGVFPSWAHKILLFLPWNLVGLFDRINFFKLVKASVEARIKRGPKEIIEDGKRSIDIIDKFLEVQDDDIAPLSMEELTAEASVLLVAGSDTTSNTLGCLFYYLAIHPEIQRQLQDELDQHVPYDSSREPESKQDLIAPLP
ncbi:cytochrome P450 monooxygenase [Rhizoctonia solani AG-1 IA]|uniref:Cytochrome P450 monooxygenase n=1 Tax=Thanatephorus cucumeris (strain AG1-IA) TaxID=983506 RepID=L8WES5_THACA|nr:cytochrome P450 monooxygenase [Rhizoctonia solani AG-1 IA]